MLIDQKASFCCHFGVEILKVCYRASHLAKYSRKAIWTFDSHFKKLLMKDNRLRKDFWDKTWWERAWGRGGTGRLKNEIFRIT